MSLSHEKRSLWDATDIDMATLRQYHLSQALYVPSTELGASSSLCVVIIKLTPKSCPSGHKYLILQKMGD